MSRAARASVHGPRKTRRPGGVLPGLGPRLAPAQPCAGGPRFKASAARQAHCACLDSERGPRRDAIGTAGRRPGSRAVAAAAGLPDRRLDAAQLSCTATACPLRERRAFAPDGCALRPGCAADAAAAAARGAPAARPAPPLGVHGTMPAPEAAGPAQHAGRAVPRHTWRWRNA